MGHRHNQHPGERLEGMMTCSQSGVVLVYCLPCHSRVLFPTHTFLPLPAAGNQLLPTARGQLSKPVFFLPHPLLHSCVSTHGPSVRFPITVGDKTSRDLTRVKADSVVAYRGALC